MVWKKGETGNKNGRPKGSRNVRHGVVDAVVKVFGSEPAYWQHIAQGAKDGDAECRRLVSARLQPTLKPQAAPIKLDLPEFTNAAECVPDVVRAIASGDIPVDDGSNLLNALLAGSKLEKLDELEAKIDKLMGIRFGNN